MKAVVQENVIVVDAREAGMLAAHRSTAPFSGWHVLIM
jgi:hypothetical protein